MSTRTRSCTASTADYRDESGDEEEVSYVSAIRIGRRYQARIPMLDLTPTERGDELVSRAEDEINESDESRLMTDESIERADALVTEPEAELSAKAMLGMLRMDLQLTPEPPAAFKFEPLTSDEPLVAIDGAARAEELEDVALGGALEDALEGALEGAHLEYRQGEDSLDGGLLRGGRGGRRYRDDVDLQRLQSPQQRV